MKRQLVPLLVAAFALMPGGAQGAQAPIKATMNNEWTPEIRKIEPGDRIVWKNPTDTPHNVTAYGSNWSKSTRLEAGETTSKIFRTKGLYKYMCTIHAFKEDGKCFGSMCGAVRVRRL